MAKTWYDIFKYRDMSNPAHVKAIAHLQEATDAEPLVAGVLNEFYELFSEQPPEAELPASGIALIKHFERFRPKAYPDAIHGWAVPTIGYGTTKYSDGSKVREGDIIEPEQAEYELKVQCNAEYFPAVMALPHFKLMSDAQRGAILSFAYNLGAHFYAARGFTSISRALSDPNLFRTVPDQLLKYRNPGSAAEPGLLRRRKSEGYLWATGKLKFDF